MRDVPISKSKIESRLGDISKNLHELKRFQGMSQEAFLANSDHFAIAEHYLRRTLEAMFDIGNHILSRLPIDPGERPTSYKGIAQVLGIYEIVPKEYANGPLLEMAGYRHRLVHFYHEVFPDELFHILQNDLKDIEIFCQYIVSLLKKPETYGLLVQ